MQTKNKRKINDYMAKFSVRYGTRIRKRYFEIKKRKQSRYKCENCGKIAVRRISTGIWKCRHCSNIYAGAAYSLSTDIGERAKKLIQNLNSNADQNKQGS